MRGAWDGRIRPLLEADLTGVLRIQAECYTEIVPESLRSLAAKATASPGTCFVAEGATGLVAYLITVPIRFPDLPALGAEAFELAPDADTLYVHDLAVAAAGRGSGVARSLVRQALEAGRQRGLPSACLVAIQQSQPVWRHLGFELVAQPPAATAAKLASYGPGARLMTARG